jgi:hypothetical protein
MTRLKLIAACVLLSSCALARPGAYAPDLPNLPRRLGVSADDWQAIRTLSERESGYYIWRVEKTRLGYVGLHMAAADGKAPPQRGPVFFYRETEDGWVKLDEMSVWERSPQAL